MNTNTALYLSNAGFPDLQIGHSLLLQAKKWLALRNLKHQVRKERRELAELPDYLLEDMGIDRTDALQEARREFSDIPQKRMGLYHS